MIEKHWGEPRNPPEHPKRPGSEVPPRPPSCLPATTHPTAPMTEEECKHHEPGRTADRGSGKARRNPAARSIVEGARTGEPAARMSLEGARLLTDLAVSVTQERAGSVSAWRNLTSG